MQPVFSHGVAGILFGVAFGSSAALAQDATAPGSAAAGLQEIVVTATRREERLQDIPQSVTAFTQENLDVQGLRNIDDVTRLTPGLTFQRNGSGSSANYNDENSDINIRGIDSTAGTSTTGLYIDDTPIQSRRIGFGTLNTFPSLFDLDRIEVLRGPQGTLFGAGSEGGAVRFIAPQPALDKNSLYTRSEIAGTENGAVSYEEGAAAGGPIIDGVLGFRASASYRNDGGYVDRVNYATASIVQPNANRQETVTFRAALKWQPTDALSVTPSFYFQDLHINDTAVYWPSLSDPSAERFRNGNAQRNPSDDPFYLVALRVELNMGWAHLISNSSFYSRNQHSTSDYSQYLRTVYLHNPLPQAGDIGSAFFTDTQNNAYQEVRLLSSDPAARLTWNAGVFLARLNENSTEYEKDNTLNQEYFAATGTPFCTTTAPCPGNVIFMQPYAKVVDRQYAGFGEVNFRILDTLKATLGVRVARVKYTGTSQLAGPDGPGATLLGSASGAQTPVTPKAVLTWQPEHGQLFYASVAKGYRVGGTNIDLGQTASCLPDLTSLGIQPGSDGVRLSPTTYQ
ncbi:MAG: TonB-dependent receptor, partial [Pseudomonadota bacterium]|nr:TonB-dependent receptor [Pseudomonadota bacterium]